MSTKKEIEKHLLEEIEKTGYPLEIEISSILDENNWFVLNQDYYRDEEQDKERTIDLFAVNVESYAGRMDEYKPFALSTDMVIECKKSNTHAWIFFTIPEIYRTPYFTGQTFEFLDAFADAKYSVLEEILPSFRDMRGESFLHYDKFQRIAVTSHEIRLDKKIAQKGRNEIFESRNQIVKCISYHFGGLRKHVKAGSPSKLIRFFFPVIVFEGRMYECIVEKGKLNLMEKNHILFRTHYRPKYHASPLSYGIDVVKREYFRTFLKDIKADIHFLEERLIEKKDKIIESVDKVLLERNRKKEGTFG